MPPKKKQQKASAYGLFCEENRDQWEIKIGKRVTMEELIKLCSSDWDHLDESVKAQYKELAKERNRNKTEAGGSPPKRLARDGDMRLDALRLPISQRKDINQLEQEELAMLDGMLPESGLNELQIVVLDVECFQKCDAQDFSIHRDYSSVSAVPAELSIGIYTMHSGIITRDTILVVPDSIPLGMGLQYRESVERHRVPIESTAADSLLPVKRSSDYMNILSQLNNQLMEAACPPGIPVFATACSRLDVIGCLNWLRRSALRANVGDAYSRREFLRDDFLAKVFSLEMLVDTFLARKNAQGSISHAEMGKIFTDTQLDYLPTVRCAFHELEQTDSVNCARLRVSKALYGLTTMFEPFFDFEKTENHLPPRIEVYATPSWSSSSASWHQSEAIAVADRPKHAANHASGGTSSFYYGDDDEEAGPAVGAMSVGGASLSYNRVSDTAGNRVGTSFGFGTASFCERTETNSMYPQRPPSTMSALSSSTIRSMDNRFSALAPFNKAKKSTSSSAAMSVSGASSAFDDADDADAESIAARRSRRDAADEFFDDDARSNASSNRMQSGKRVLPAEGGGSDSEADTVTDCDDLLHRETVAQFDNRSMNSSMTSWSSAMRTSVSELTDKYVNNQSFTRPQQVDYGRPGAHSSTSTSDRLPSLGRGRGRNVPLMNK